MANETSTEERTEIARFVTRQDRSAPLLVHGLVVSRNPRGMVIAQFYHDYLEVPKATTVFSRGDGDISIESDPPVGVRHVLATIVMDPEVAEDIGRLLVKFAANTGDEEQEE